MYDVSGSFVTRLRNPPQLQPPTGMEKCMVNRCRNGSVKIAHVAYCQIVLQSRKSDDTEDLAKVEF